MKSLVLIKNVAVRADLVEFITVISPFEGADKAAVLHISLSHKEFNIPMTKVEADAIAASIVAGYMANVLKVENYVINLDKIHFADIQYQGSEVRLHIQFIENDLDLIMKEDKAKKYLVDMTK
jgi:hypothetical protein